MVCDTDCTLCLLPVCETWGQASCVPGYCRYTAKEHIIMRHLNLNDCFSWNKPRCYAKQTRVHKFQASIIFFLDQVAPFWCQWDDFPCVFTDTDENLWLCIKNTWNSGFMFTRLSLPPHELKALNTAEWNNTMEGFSVDINRLYLLCVSFFQKGAPELVIPERFGEHQLVVAGGDAVVHNHIDPFAITPELCIRRKKRFKTCGD